MWPFQKLWFERGKPSVSCLFCSAPDFHIIFLIWKREKDVVKPYECFVLFPKLQARRFIPPSLVGWSNTTLDGPYRGKPGNAHTFTKQKELTVSKKVRLLYCGELSWCYMLLLLLLLFFSFFLFPADLFDRSILAQGCRWWITHHKVFYASSCSSKE